LNQCFFFEEIYEKKDSKTASTLNPKSLFEKVKKQPVGATSNES